MTFGQQQDKRLNIQDVDVDLIHTKTYARTNIHTNTEYIFGIYIFLLYKYFPGEPVTEVSEEKRTIYPRCL